MGATSKGGTAPLRAVLQLAKGESARVGEARIRLLEAIAEQGSISAAAKSVGLSYKGAWDAVQALNNLSDHPLVLAHPGGAAGGAAQVTASGALLVSAFRRIEAELLQVADRLGHGLAGDAEPLTWSLGMRTSARNALRGVVAEIRPGAVDCEVQLAVSPQVRIVAVVTRDSAEDLGLEVGRPALALIKSSFVILAEAGPVLRTSARNSWRMFGGDGEPPAHWSDPWTYGAAPAVAYVVLFAVGAAGWTLGVGVMALVILLCGIRNAWDLITWIAPMRGPGGDAASSGGATPPPV